MSNGGSATFRDDIDMAGSLNMTGSSKVIKLNGGGYIDFDSTNLQFNTQRNPNTGAFNDANKSHAHIGLQGADGGSKIIFGTAAANNTTATTRMTIGKDGNVGIGVVPQDLIAGNIQLDVGTQGCGITSRQNYETNITANAYYGTYATTNKPATRLTLTNSGEFHFGVDNGATRTAGQAITFVRAFTILNDGNISVGSTAINGTFGTSNTILSVKGKTSGGEGILQVTGLGNTSGDNTGRVSFHSYAEADEMASIRAVRGNSDDVGDLEFYTNSGGGAASQRMRITSDGEVKIGTTTVNSNGLTIEKTGNHIFLRNSSNTTAGQLWNFDVTSANRLYLINQANTGVTMASGDTSWSAHSDISIKENIKPLKNVLDKIKDYKCVEYNLKSDKNKGKKIGFIAQDWENDFAPIVNKDDDGLLGMKYTETIPVLLKAIQELKAEVDKLKQECKCK